MVVLLSHTGAVTCRKIKLIEPFQVSYTPISLAGASLVIIASMALLQKGMKHGRSALECQILWFPAMHHAFCTLVLRSWRFRCANTMPSVCFYCICHLYRAFYTIKPMNMRLKYDQGVPVAFVVRLGRPCYASDMLMALCCIKAPKKCCSNPDCRPPRRPPTRDRGIREKQMET